MSQPVSGVPGSSGSASSDDAPRPGTTYTPRAGDTPRGIAQVAYGDERYWTLIRDANAGKILAPPGGAPALAPGVASLVLPAKTAAPPPETTASTPSWGRGFETQWTQASSRVEQAHANAQANLVDAKTTVDAVAADAQAKLKQNEANLKNRAVEARQHFDERKAELEADLTDDVKRLKAKAKLNVGAMEARVQAEAKRTGKAIDDLRQQIKDEIDRLQGVYARDAHLPAVRRRHFQPGAAPPSAGGSAAAGQSGPISPDPVVSVHGIPIETYGASAAAVAEAQGALALETARPDIAAQLAARHVTIVIIPQNVRMTDLPEFANLRGQKTFDGRPWEDVRGVGGTPLRDGRVVVGIAEEDLAKLPGDQYPTGFSVAKHEIGHVVQDYGLPAAERQATIDDYKAFMHALSGNAALQDDPQYYGNASWYGNANYQEHWAMGTNLLTGTDEGEGPAAGMTSVGGARWVYSHDPKLYGHLVNAYPAVAKGWNDPNQQ